MTRGERQESRALARHGSTNLAGSVVASASNVVLVLVIARGTSPQAAGALFAAMSIFLVSEAVARLGATTGMVYWVARLRQVGTPAELRRCLVVALAPVLAVGALLSLVMLWAADWAGGRIAAGLPLASQYVAHMAPFLACSALGAGLLAATRGLETMRPTVLVDKLIRPASQLVLVSAVLLADRPGLLALAWALPYALTLVLSAWWLSRLMRGRTSLSAHPDAVPDGEPFSASAYWRFTFPRAVNVVVQLALQRLDIVIVAALRGPTEAAIYTAASRFLVAGQMASQSIAWAAQPRISALMAIGDSRAAGRIYQVATGWLVLFAWPVFLGCIIFREEMLALFGPAYVDAGAVVVILGTAMLLATSCGMVDTMLNMAGRTSWTLANSVLALGTMVGVDLLLVPELGAVGAALGWAASILVNNLVPMTQLRVFLGLHPWGPETRLALAVAGVPFGAAAVVTFLLPLGVWGGLAAVVTASVLTVTGAARRQRDLQLDAFLHRRKAVSDTSRSPETVATP